MRTVIQYVLYLAILIVLAIPLGAYMKKVMCGEKTVLSKVLTPCENAVYRVMRINPEEEMDWKNTHAAYWYSPALDWYFCSCFSLCRACCPAIRKGFPV